MSRLTKYSTEAPSDPEDWGEYGIWLADALTKIHQKCKEIISAHLARISKN
jgi:hypothetical protein